MPDEVSDALGDFFDTIWRDTQGYVYIATLEQGNNFRQYMLEWPKKRAVIVRNVLAQSAEGKDVYFSPALYSGQRPTKENVMGSWVLWADFDGNAPEDWAKTAEGFGIPEPTIRVQSSVKGQEHVYWTLTSFLDSVERIEDRNRSVAYRLGADTSGWDADQLLRPPFTSNYGYKGPRERKSWYSGAPLDVNLAYRADDTSVEGTLFDGLGTPEREYLARLRLGDLPPLDEVLALGTWTSEFWQVFKFTKQEASEASPDKRSGTIMRLGYLAAEAGFSDEQMYVVLDDADTRWEKYTTRSKSGRDKLLRDIIARARAKVGYLTTEELTFAGLLGDDTPVLTEAKLVYSFGDFLATEVHLDWLLEGFLAKQGFIVVTGQPGVGKTQFGIQVAATLALSLDKFLLWPSTGTPKKAFFLSLEMSHAPLKHFMDRISGAYAELRTLDRNFHIAPLGQGIPLDHPQGQAFMDNLMAEYRPDVLVIDSLQKTTNKELTDETASKQLVTYLKRLREKYGTAMVLVHHNRKRTTDTARTDLSDMYGSQFLSAEVDAVVNLRRLGDTKMVGVDCWKNRLATTWPSFTVERTKNLQYRIAEEGVGVYADSAVIIGPESHGNGAGSANLSI